MTHEVGGNPREDVGPELGGRHERATPPGDPPHSPTPPPSTSVPTPGRRRARHQLPTSGYAPIGGAGGGQYGVPVEPPTPVGLPVVVPDVEGEPPPPPAPRRLSDQSTDKTTDDDLRIEQPDRPSRVAAGIGAALLIGLLLSVLVLVWSPWS